MITLSKKHLKQLLIGRPFPSRAELHERLDNVRALAIFASDPISSNAYASEAIMTVLVVLGAGALAMTFPLALGIVALVALVVLSYIQTILHYPDGGGAYTVAKDNLGRYPALLAAAALLIDYILTVAVSVSAGIRALTSAFPGLLPHAVSLALLAILLLTWVNLRGARETGTIFALPTYAFVAGVFVVIALGLVRLLGLGGATPLPVEVAGLTDDVRPVSRFLFVWLVLRAFAAGCTALTGIEAISNGVQAFRPPESRNAAKTMIAMGAIAMSLFAGITLLSTRLQLVPLEHESLLSQMTRAIAGGGVLYFWVQFSTMFILILAANTGYQDFPRLASFLARDGFLPRWLQNRGDRLVYSAGIVALAVLAATLVALFQADEIAMLPLYALGVMLSFTLSQSGMFRLLGRIAHLKPGETLRTAVTTAHYERGIFWKRPLNAVGAAVTAIVLLVLIVTKFGDGAWVVIVMLPLLVLMFRAIHRHYETVAATLSTRELDLAALPDIGDVVIVPIGDVHRGTLMALRFARRIAPEVRAVCICTDDTVRERVLRRWARFPELTHDISLELIDYEYRDVLTPLVDYIVRVKQVGGARITPVVIPAFVPDSLFGQMLHNQTAELLRLRLRHVEGVVVIDVPYQVHG